MSNKWLVDIDINNYIYEGLKKLDYELEFAEDRNKLVKQILDDLDKDGLLTNYFSSAGYIKKQIKNKNSFLAETEPTSKLLARFAYYLDYPKYNNKDDKENDRNRKKEYYTLSSDKLKNAPHKEGLTEDIKIKENQIIDIDFKNGTKKKDVNFRLVPKQTIAEKDRKEFWELDEYCLLLEQLNKILGLENGISKEEREAIQKRIIENKGENYFRMLKRIRQELIKELPLIKDRLRGTIYFKKLEKGYPVYDLENDTGYVNEQGEYVEVSENKIELNNPKHILAIIDNYSILKESCWDKIDSDLWYIIYEVENLIEKADLEPYEKDIIILKIDGLTGEDICKEINKKYNMTLTEDNLSRIYNTYIPKKIANTYDDLYEEWLYTYKVKGKYKKCRKCGEIKLISNDRYFGRDSRNKDGFKSICKKCDSYTKNCKK